MKEVSSKEASNRLLIPIDSFWLEGPNGKHLTLAYELFGPDLGYLKENGPSDDIFPVHVTQKIIVDALEAVNFLHAQALCHGGKPFNTAVNYEETTYLILQPLTAPHWY